MHQNIHSPASGLESVHRKGQLRIADSKKRPMGRTVKASFQSILFIGDHAGLARLASRGGQRQNIAMRKCLRRNGFLHEVFPWVNLRIRCPIRNTLCGVDHTAASYRQNKVHVLTAADLHAFQRLRQRRIRLHSAK